MSIECDQCNTAFESNFRLYQHKTLAHGPAVALVTNTNSSKRAPPPPANPNDHVKKYIKIDERTNTDKKRPYPDDDDEDVGNSPKHYKIDHRGRKRKGSDDDDVGNSPKRYKIDHRGRKRKGSDDDDDRSAKHRKIDLRGLKRNLSLSDDETSPKRVKRDNRGSKRALYSSADEQEPDKYRRKNSPKKSRQSDIIARLKNEIVKWKSRYRSAIRKHKQNEEECMARIEVLKKQLQEIEEIDGDYELKSISNAVINSVTIQEFNEIRTLISNHQLARVLKSRKYILALQKLFLGLTYGVVPITAPQRIALSIEEKRLITDLEHASVDKVKSYIKENQKIFLRLFSIINDSLKLVTKSYVRYGST